MLRELYISNNQAYGEGYYGMGYYGGFSPVTIADDWSWKREINQQSTFNFTIIENALDLTIDKGLEVRFLIDGEISYAGIIYDYDAYEPIPGTLYYKISCQTFELLLQKRRIGAVFNNKTAGYIIKYMIDNILYEDNIVYGTIEEGLTFDKVIFNWKSCYEALSKLQTACPGYNFYIDFDKKLHFVKRTSNTSTHVIDETFVHNDFHYKDTLAEFRDIMYIEGGQKETTEQPNYTPTPKPDGESREFTVQFPISQEPTIETNVNGAGWVTQTVGINGIDTGKQFYWTYGSSKVTQDSSEVVLTDTNPAPDEIRITYYGLLDIRLLYEDNPKILERAAIDGNSGKYEEVFQNKDIATNAAAVQYAQGLIEKYYDNKVVDLIIEDNIYDFEPNRLVKIEKTLYNIDDWFLIKSVQASQQTPEHATYKVKLLSGEDVGGWEDYFGKLLSFQGELTSDDTLIKFKGVSELINVSGVINIDIFDKLYPDVDLYPNVNLYPGTLTSEVTLYD
ncbi:MAG: hypothetical protein ACFFDH_00415 [Promethearchaeota archaeon]